MFQARPMAKVNLTLEVLGRRADGYHELRSVFLRIALSDRLMIGFGPLGSRDQLAVEGLPGCPVEGNLVLHAFELVRDAVDVNLPPLSAVLEKQIPIGAGLAGGSSDGAAAIDLAAAAWGVRLSQRHRAQLALALGSDVPFFAFAAPMALVSGRGEAIAPLPAVRSGAGILLALSGVGLSTARVFERFDELEPPDPTDRPTDRLADALGDGITGTTLAELAADLGDANELWPAASSLSPQLVDRRAALAAATDRRWLLSGSGPTLFSIFGSLDEARSAGTSLVDRRPPELRDVMLCATDLDNPDNAWRQPWPSVG